MDLEDPPSRGSSDVRRLSPRVGKVGAGRPSALSEGLADQDLTPRRHILEARDALHATPRDERCRPMSPSSDVQSNSDVQEMSETSNPEKPLLLKDNGGAAKDTGGACRPRPWQMLLLGAASLGAAAWGGLTVWRLQHQCCDTAEPECLACQAEAIAASCRERLRNETSHHWTLRFLKEEAANASRSPAPGRGLRLPYNFGRHRARSLSHNESIMKHPGMNCEVPCGFTEGGVDYPGADFRVLPDISGPGECCSRCKTNDNCTAWSWEVTEVTKKGDPLRSACHLKRPSSLVRVRSGNFVSGLPFAGERDGEIILAFNWALWNGPTSDRQTELAEPRPMVPAARLEVTLTTTTTTTTTTATSTSTTVTTSTRTTSTVTTTTTTGLSLYCWALMLSTGYEPGLLRMQEAANMGIFGCEYAAIFSNVKLKIGRHPVHYMPIDLHCKIGGQWKTALNTPIFKKVWHQVMKDGDFERYDWTVKVDPDTVFIAARMKQILYRWQREGQEDKGVALMNCHGTLHGPLEVLSRRAVLVYKESQCWDQSSIPQEDVYIHQCLAHHHVHLAIEPLALAEAQCYSNGHLDVPTWHQCTSGHASFHPFKEVWAWRHCHDVAAR